MGLPSDRSHEQSANIEFANSISSGTENLHRHRIVSGNAHIADKHESMWLRNPPQNSSFCDRVLPQQKASEPRQESRCRETQEFCKTAMSLGFLTEEQASRVVQAQSQGRQFLPLCGFSVPLLILLANSAKPHVDIPRHDESPYDDGVAERSEP